MANVGVGVALIIPLFDYTNFEDRRMTLSRPGTVLLDTARPDEGRRESLLFTDPTDVLTATTLAEVPSLLDALDAALAAGTYVAGYLAYEAGYAFEPEVFDAPLLGEGPLGWFGVYAAPRRLAETDVRALLADADDDAPLRFDDAHLSLTRAAYRDKIGAIKQHIREGDVYQINFTDLLRFGFDGSPVALFRALRGRQRVAFGGYLDTGAERVLCLSPELFFRREGDRLTARPMKGTAPRGRTLAEDEAHRRWLAHDEKNRAENLMIVDLLRNDLSRCCVPGSVQVPALFSTEIYETLIQMTSTVEGRLREGMGLHALFRALFPCGSVTGAPKIRAMQLIQALEAGPRGIYCGALGYAAPGGEATFNVAIRTLVLRAGHGTMGLGSGIVWDSDADAEYDECLLKARFLQEALAAPAEAFALIETMRAEAGQIALLDLHAARLAESAQYFAIPFDEAAFRTILHEKLATLPPDAHKIRLTLDRDGVFEVTAALLQEDGPPWSRACLAATPVHSGDVSLYHKTTRRAVYECALAEARAAGFDEAILTNERGEVTEGTHSNVFVEQDGAWRTPPVTSGLLDGVFRRHLLATLPHAAEAVLTPEDLFAADAVYLCNAVRGVHRVELGSGS